LPITNELNEVARISFQKTFKTHADVSAEAFLNYSDHWIESEKDRQHLVGIASVVLPGL
jgi:hypothetical protein